MSMSGHFPFVSRPHSRVARDAFARSGVVLETSARVRIRGRARARFYAAADVDPETRATETIFRVTFLSSSLLDDD